MIDPKVVRLEARRSSAFAALVAIAFIAAGGSASAVPQTLPRGDVNRDGRFDSADALKVLRHLRGDVGATLDDEGLFAADLAPLSATGQSQPDQKVDLGDLVVLLRLVKGELGAAAPTLDPLPPPTSNPLADPEDPVRGTGPAGATIHLFVSDGAGAIVHVDTTIANLGNEFSFPSVPMLFEGNNEFFAMAVTPNGLVSRPSAALATTWTSPASCSVVSPISATVVWTTHCAEYVIPNNGLTVNSSARLILGPGVVLRFNDSNDPLQVDGTLQVLGAGSRTVHLTSNASWKGIDFTSTSGTSSFLSYARVDQVSAGNTAIRLESPSPLVAVAVRHSVVDVGASVSGIRVAFTAQLTLEWSQVFGDGPNGTTGVWLEAASPQISVISHSRISDFSTCFLSRSSTIPHKVSHTELDSCATGVNLKASVADLSPGNWIHGNDTGISLSTSGSGLFPTCWPSSNPGAVRDSTIDNVQNVSVQQNASWRCTGSGSPAPDRAVFDASRNYWGATNPSIIASKIDDFTDHIALSPAGMEMLRDDQGGLLVDFTPFRLAQNGQLEYTYIGGRLDQDFGAAIPVLPVRKAVGPLLVHRATTATIPAGNTIETFLDPNSASPIPVEILVSGKLLVQGTAQDPVEFKAPGPAPQPGDWWGIRFDTDSFDSKLEHIRVRHAVEAIRATDTNVSIEGADIALFERAGIVFERITNDVSPAPVINSEILNSVIDGMIDPGPPPVTVKDDVAQRNVAGVQVIDSCRPVACLGSISGNTIRNLVTGIHVVGGSDPQILDNVITDNTWGIWLEGETVAAPNPVLHLNEIHDNQGLPPIPPLVQQEDVGFRVCSNAGANLCLSGYPETIAATTLIDASQNYWGVVSPEGVRASVMIAKGKRVAVNVAEFLDAQGSVVGPADLLSATIVAITAQDATAEEGNPVIRPTVVPGDDLEITFRLQRAADVVIQIFQEAENTLTATPLRTFSFEDLAVGGPYSTQWDGRDASLNFVPDGAYVFVIVAKDPVTGAVIDRYDPPRNEDASVPGKVRGGDRGESVADASSNVVFNSFVNDFMTYKFELKAFDPLPPFSSRVTARIRRRPVATDPCNTETGSGEIIATPWLDKPLTIGVHKFLWDGRADVVATGLVPGDLVAENVQNPEFPDLCLIFERPGPLKPSHVIVEKTLPRLEGTGMTPEVEVKSNPYFIQPSYDQSSALTFKVLEQSAFITLLILEPGEMDIGNAVSSIEIDGNNVLAGRQAVPANTMVTYHWKGHPDTAGDSNLLEAMLNGAYTFALEAEHTEDTPPSSVYRGVIHVRGEREER